MDATDNRDDALPQITAARNTAARLHADSVVNEARLHADSVVNDDLAIPEASDAIEVPSSRVKGYSAPRVNSGIDWFSERSVNMFCGGAIAIVVVSCAYLVYLGIEVFSGR